MRYLLAIFMTMSAIGSVQSSHNKYEDLREEFRQFQKSILKVVPKEIKLAARKTAEDFLKSQKPMQRRSWCKSPVELCQSVFSNAQAVSSIRELAANVWLHHATTPGLASDKTLKVLLVDIDDTLFFSGRMGFLSDLVYQTEARHWAPYAEQFNVKDIWYWTDMIRRVTDTFLLDQTVHMNFEDSCRMVLEDWLGPIFEFLHKEGFQIFGWTRRPYDIDTPVSLLLNGIDFSKYNDFNEDFTVQFNNKEFRKNKGFSMSYYGEKPENTYQAHPNCNYATNYRRGIMYVGGDHFAKGWAIESFLDRYLAKKTQGLYDRVSISAVSDEAWELLNGEHVDIQVAGIKNIDLSVYLHYAHLYLSPDESVHKILARSNDFAVVISQFSLEQVQPTLRDLSTLLLSIQRRKQQGEFCDQDEKLKRYKKMAFDRDKLFRDVSFLAEHPASATMRRFAYWCSKAKDWDNERRIRQLVWIGYLKERGIGLNYADPTRYYQLAMENGDRLASWFLISYKKRTK